MNRLSLSLLFAGWLVLIPPAQGQPRPDTVEPPPASLKECDTLLMHATGAADVSLCYLDWASVTNQWDEASKHLQARLAKSPGDPRLLAALAQNRAQVGDFEAMFQSYKLALDGYLAENNAEGEAVARQGIGRYYQETSRFEKAEEQLRLAESAAVASGDELARVDIQVSQAWLAFRRGNLSRASTVLKAADPRFRDALAQSRRRSRRQVRLEATISNAFGAIYWALVKPREAIEAYQKEASVGAQLGDSYEVSTALYNLALVAANNQRRLGLELADVIKQTEAALKAALNVGNPKNEMTCRLLLGNLLAVQTHRSGGRDFGPAIKQVETALRLSRELQDEPNHNGALQTLARLYSDQYGNLQESLQLFDEVLSSAVRRHNLEEVAWAHFYRFDLLVRNRKFDSAVPFGLKALEAVERIRDLQSDSDTRARLFSSSSEKYRDVYNVLINLKNRGSDRKSLELAVSVIERMRARELLSDLDRASATSRLMPEGKFAEQRSLILQQISSLQSRLLSEELSKMKRAALIREVDGLELELKQVEQALGQASQKYKLVHAPDFATLQEVQETLDESEAVLSYQLLNSKGSLLRITRDSVNAFPVPSRYQLADSVEFLAGLIRRRDRTESRGTQFLYHELAEAALKGLPTAVKRLVVVPDAGLEKLPFGALQAGPVGPRLAEKYDVVVTPSLTTWLRWNKTNGKALGRQLLALADPRLPIQDSGNPTVARERGWTLAQELSLGSLPRARSEGRSAVRSLSGNGRLVVGRDASEHFIKQVDPAEYAVIHFASHALVDETNPERTALLLAPGSETEDGLLQVREIVNLDLDGQLVVLSACQSASGEVLSGEGILSLARAFFVAGAHAVVGSLWPLRDDDAAAFFSRFYFHLGEGENAAAALADAQRDRIAEGAPVAAWAGLVVLGNGNLTPFPGGIHQGNAWWPWLLLPALGILAMGLAIRTLRQRKNSMTRDW